MIFHANVRFSNRPVMEWSGRAPAPPVTNLARGSKDKGARQLRLLLGYRARPIGGAEAVPIQRCERGKVNINNFHKFHKNASFVEIFRRTHIAPSIQHPRAQVCGNDT